MKITTEQLKRIIKEELDSIQEPGEAFTAAVHQALEAGMDSEHMMAIIEIQARTAAGTHEMPDGSVVAPK
jgi:hypothetical protein